MTHIVSEFACFKVAHYYTEGIEYLLHGNQLLEPTGDASDLSVTDVDLLVVEFVTGWVLPYLNNAAHSEVNVGDVRENGLSAGSLSWCLFGRVLYLLLFWLLHFLLWCAFIKGLLLNNRSLLSFDFFIIFHFWLYYLCHFLDGCNLRPIPSLLRKLLELAFGRRLCVLIGKRHKETSNLNLLKEAGQMLHVVEPPEGMGGLQLLVVREGLEVRDNVDHDCDVGGGDGVTD